MQFKINSKPMEKWDARFIELAKFGSAWSKDPKARVGAVVVAKRGGAVSIGYNGFPMGVEDSAERLKNKKMKLELIVHAEQNALIAAGPKAEGATIYVWGKPVCAKCAGAIIQAGIKRVVALSPESVEPSSRWHNTGKLSHEMFRESEVQVDFYTVSATKDEGPPKDAPVSGSKLRRKPKK